MDNKKENGLWNDIQSHLLKFLTVLLPMVTLVPLFINRTHQIFNLPFNISFLFFVFLYFVLPILIILISIGYQDYRYSNLISADNKIDKSENSILIFSIYTNLILKLFVRKFKANHISLFFCLVLFLYFPFIVFIVFVDPFKQIDSVIWIFGCVYFSIFTISVLINSISNFIRYGRVIRKKNENVNIIYQKELLFHRLRLPLIQYIIIVLTIIIVWVVWFINHKQVNTIRSNPKIANYLNAFDLYDGLNDYSKPLQNLQDTLEELFFLARTNGITVIDKNSSQATWSIINPSMKQMTILLYDVFNNKPTEYFNHDEFNSFRDTIQFNLYNKCLENIISSVRKALINNSNDTLGDNLANFSDKLSYEIHTLNNIVSFKKNNLEKQTRERWSQLLQKIQFYSFSFFPLVIIFLLTLWLFYSINGLYFENVLNKKRDEPISYTENFNPLLSVKTSITIMVLLLFPFLRQLDADHINLENSFLNFTLSNLVNADNNPPVKNLNSYYGPFYETRIDSALYLSS